MKPPDRPNRTTLRPGVVDLPASRPRRSPEEIALEKRKKHDAAAAKAETQRLAAARVAELEIQTPVVARSKGRNTSALTKQSRKRPTTDTTRDVSFFRSSIR